MKLKLFKSGSNTPTLNDLEFERALEEYTVVIRRLKAKAIRKYGVKASKWFGL